MVLALPLDYPHFWQKHCPSEERQMIIEDPLLELDERRGWKALGYTSMQQCILNEFGRSQSQLYRELKAGKIEKTVSPHGER